MYPSDGQGQRRSHRTPQRQDNNNYGFYNQGHQPQVQSPRPPRPNGVSNMHQVVDAFHNHPQSPQPEPQQGYPKYGYDNYAPAMPQYAPNSPHLSANQGRFVNSSNHSQRQMGQQNMQGQTMQGQSMQSPNMQNQFYASAWDQSTSMPNSYQPPPQVNGMAPMQHNMNQPLPPTGFYNPNAGATRSTVAVERSNSAARTCSRRSNRAGFGGPAPSLQNAVPAH